MNTKDKENLIREFHNSETLVRHNISKSLITNTNKEVLFWKFWKVTEPWRNYIDVKLFARIEMALESEKINEIFLEYVTDIIKQNENLTSEESEWWKEWVNNYWENVSVDISHRIFSGKGRKVPKIKYPKIKLINQFELNENIDQITYGLDKWNLNIYLIKRQSPKLFWIHDGCGRLQSCSNYETFLKIKT